MNLTSEVVLPLPLDSHSPLQIHVKTNRPSKASAGFEVIESLSLFPFAFLSLHEINSYSMHCLQASLMSADFFSCYLSDIGQCVLLFTVLHALSFSGIPWKPNSISV